MVSSTRLAAALVTAAVSLVPMACGDNAAAMRATLTNDGCKYEGDTYMTAGVVAIEGENQTQFSGAFGLVSLAVGSTVDDLKSGLEKHPEQFVRDGTLPKPPPQPYRVWPDYYALWGRSSVPAGTIGQLTANVPVGTYVVVCFFDAAFPANHVYIAKRLEVTD